jgi:hypothetical protein
MHDSCLLYSTDHLKMRSCTRRGDWCSPWGLGRDGGDDGGGARPERRSTSVNWDALAWSWTATRTGAAALWTWLRDAGLDSGMIPASCKGNRGAFRYLRPWRRRTRHREGAGRDGSLLIHGLQNAGLDSLAGREEN